LKDFLPTLAAELGLKLRATNVSHTFKFAKTEQLKWEQWSQGATTQGNKINIYQPQTFVAAISF
jgi:hypothetical protein